MTNSDSNGGPGDQAVRERALMADASFIVQAPAGSGKTELLIQRYLGLLARVSEPEEIVAITFTRKAAAEMRERIVDALRGAVAGRASDDAVAARRLELAAAAMENDHRHGWSLIHHPARLQIQTIDALCLGLTRQLPFLSGFAAPTGIVDDARTSYQRAALETVKLLGGPEVAWRQALRRFLFHVDNDLGRGTALLADMLAARDQWLRHVGEDSVSPEDLETAWRHVIEMELQRARTLFPASLVDDVVTCANEAAGRIAAESTAGAPAARDWLGGEGFPGSEPEALPRWRFLGNLLLTQSGQWRKNVNKNLGFPPRSPAKPAMQALLDALADGNDATAAALRAVQGLPDPGFEPGYTEVLNALATVLKLAVAQLQVVFEETGEVDFVEVNQRALAALGALEDPSDLALKLDYQMHHLLVDEFQDTSIAQYQLLRLLTQGWAPGDGKTLFLVGDPMQSIYRFREAEVGVFLRVWEDGLADLPVEPLRLASNFRSAAAVVDWVNGAFGDCFPGAPDLQSGAVAYAASTAQRAAVGGDAGVYVHPLIDRTEAGQADELAILIGEALARSVDVAVLVRARSHLEALLPALRAHDIPYSGMDVTALINESTVRDLYSLTRSLLHPGDRMAWLSLLRAPWCGLVLSDLLTVARDRDTPIWQALHDPDIRADLSTDGLARLDRLAAALAEAMAQRGRLTLRQWTRRAWIALDGPALAGEPGIQHANAYFELLGRHQSGMALQDERVFHNVLQGHWAHSEAPTGAVQLMTIHRAKGLEFDEVFLPGLERSVSGDDKRLLLWEEPLEGEGLLLATLSERGAEDDAHYRYLQRLQAAKSENETDRLFYVACTRARNRLHLLANLDTRDGEPRPPREHSLLRRVWPRVAGAFAVPAREGARPVQGELDLTRRGQSLRRLPVDWRAPASPPAPWHSDAAPVDEQHIEFSWAGETARHVGILVHEVMQHMAAEGLGEWDAGRVEALLPWWRERLAHIGVPSRELDAASRRAADAIGNVLEDDRAIWLLDGDQREATDEYELSMLSGDRVRRLRIDRTFVDTHGVRWIVDYKTSAHEGGNQAAFLDREVERYREQLERYAEAFRRMGEGQIHLGLYFPLLKGWREWEYAG